MNEATPSSGFLPWWGEIMATVGIILGVCGAFIRDRLEINRKITAVETKVDLLIQLQTAKND